MKCKSVRIKFLSNFFNTFNSLSNHEFILQAYIKDLVIVLMQTNVNEMQLNSREYKIILDATAFTSIDDAKEKVLQILESQLATQKITFRKKDTKREKKVYYFDTDN